MNKVLWILLFALMVILNPTLGFTYSLVGDWSNAVNPNGPWSYNAGSTPLTTNLVNWPAGELGPTQTAWTNGWMPGWFKSVVNPNSLGRPGSYDWMEGDVVVHASDGQGIDRYGQANVTWTSPTAGIYDITGGLWAGRDIGRSNDWNLYLNDSLLASGRVFSGDIYSRSNPNVFGFDDLYIAQGGVLKLEVFRTISGEDFVGVNFDINPSAVPEPATILLFGMGGVGLVFRRFSRGRV